MRHPIVLLLAVTALTAGCAGRLPNATTLQIAQAKPAASSATMPAAGTAAAPNGMAGMAMVKSLITGDVMIPAKVLSQNGAGLISNNSGGLVSNNAGSLVSDKGGSLGGMAMSHTAAVDNGPLANATVYLADAGGSPVPGMPTTTTDAQGHYSLKDIPSGSTFVVIVQRKLDNGKTLSFQTLVRSRDLGATANVDAASTLATAGVLQSATSDLGDFKPATFQNATEVVRAKLTDDSLPDFTSRAAVIAKVNELAQTVSELKDALNEIQQDLTQIKEDHMGFRQDIEELKKEVADLKKKLGDK